MDTLGPNSCMGHDSEIGIALEWIPERLFDFATSIYPFLSGQNRDSEERTDPDGYASTEYVKSYDF